MIQNSPIPTGTPKKSRERLEQINNSANAAGHGGRYHRTLHGTVYFNTPTKKTVSSGGTSPFDYLLWNYSGSCKKGNYYVVTGSTMKYYNDVDEVWTYPGIYYCKKAVPEATGSLDESLNYVPARTGSVFFVPYYRAIEPTGSEYWINVRLGPTQFTTCDASTNETQTSLIDGVQEFEPTTCDSQSVIYGVEPE